MTSVPREQESRPIRPWSVRSWPMWETPSALLTSILLVELTAAGLVATSALAGGLPTRVDIVRMVILGLLGLTHTEAVLRTERLRRRITAPHHIDLSSVWIFAGAIVLPVTLAVVVTVVVQFHIWARTGRPKAAYYRHVFTTATMVLACLGASAVVGRAPSTLTAPALLTLVLALLVFTTVNTALIAGAIAMSSAQPNLATALGDWDDNVLEVATLSLGGLTAVALLINPWLVLLVLPSLLVLHRAVLVRHLQEAASIDGKTGLLNAATWHTRAERELQRVTRGREPRAVLVLDLDHFKAVNDTHGHLAGDQVLAAVADALRSEVRDRDLVGRFGGEEFVVLLSGRGGGDGTDLEAVAERIRRRVAALRVEIPTADGPLTIAGLSISVGGAVHPDGVGDLRELLQIADTALYAAKRAGRNTVRMESLPCGREQLPALIPSDPVSDAQ
ncbi:GGDEF domain-containing protein [Pseudonocardia sp. 73-21]|uniref:GGDEF domain-containing protein n=1 Tax=Pseudonocardia sp. 73-21 TaxID=1895809 RepID=UPI00260CD8AF|nr:GGDEF domain-containing protein [Pseudonocardia sp. 73-21]